tara:strand:+ start:445 stop:612 length:168 start_codon:yes stop_codon:yes gene_type:complete
MAKMSVKKQKMSKSKRERLKYFVENYMSKKDKGRNKKAAMVKYCGIVRRSKDDKS